MMPQLSFVFLLGVLLVSGMSVLAFPADSIAVPSLNIPRLKPSLYNVGDTGAVVCVVDNVTDPVEWISPSGDTVGNSSKNRRLYVERVPKHEDMMAILVFESTKLTDSGNWTCKSSYLSDTVEIVVEEKVFEEIQAEERKNVKLTCEAKGNAETNVTWYKELHSKTSDVKISLFQNSKYVISKENNTYTLEIRRLTPIDSGKYTCDFSQEALQPYTRKTFNLAVHPFSSDSTETLSLNMPTKPFVFNVGENRSIYCSVNNVKDPVEWISPSGDTVGNKSINSRLYVDSDDNNISTLVIHNTKLTDSGNWTCKSGDHRDTHQIIVGEKVVMQSDFEEIHADEGKNAKLICYAKGIPEPTVTWYKNYFRITEDSKYVIGKIDNTNTLEVRRLTQADSGGYMCKATQEALSHYTQKIIKLTVHPFSADSTKEPSLNILRLKSSVYNVGDTGAIVCVVERVKDPVEWISPSGDTVGNSSENSKLYVERQPKPEEMLAILVIDSTKLTDSGNWTCKSGNLSDTVKIIVGEKVVMPTKFEEIQANERKNAKLTCEAKGNPEPTVTWYRELHSKTSDVKISIFQDSKHILRKKNNIYTLEIKRLTHADSGNYTCDVAQKALDHYTGKTINLAVHPFSANSTEEPSLNMPTKPFVFNVGENRSLYCSANNVKDPAEWISPSGDTVGGRSINSRLYVDRDDNNILSTLVIQSTKVTDSGNWTCKSGDHRATVKIIVGENDTTKIAVTESSNPDVGSQDVKATTFSSVLKYEGDLIIP